MSNIGWAVIENIFWGSAFLICLLFLEGNWRWFCIVPVVMVNIFSWRKPTA